MEPGASRLDPRNWDFCPQVSFVKLSLRSAPQDCRKTKTVIQIYSRVSIYFYTKLRISV